MSTKQMSNHAHAAKLIRAELKKAFPLTKFSVTSESYSMGNSIRIHWNNGPTTNAVKEISKKYQEGHFDGMTDCYEYSNTRKDIPQVMFINVTRTITENIYLQAIEELKKKWPFLNGMALDDYINPDLKIPGLSPRNFAYQHICVLDLTNGLDLKMLNKVRNGRIESDEKAA